MMLSGLKFSLGFKIVRDDTGPQELWAGMRGTSVADKSTALCLLRLSLKFGIHRLD